MSVEFRQRSAGDFIQMLNRRKWQIALPTIAFFLATAWVVTNLPNVYESKTSLIIMPPTISEKVAPSLTDADLSKRILAMRPTVLNRQAIEDIVVKFDLYPEERANGTSWDQIHNKLNTNIKIETQQSEDRKVLGFSISVKDHSPEDAQAVAAEIAERYVDAQNVESTQSAEMTREFIDAQLSQAKSNLDALEKERLHVMIQNVETLPESGQGLIAQLEGLRDQEATISKEKETLMTEKGRIQESIRALNSQMRLIENFGERETREAVNQASRVEDTPAYGQLIQRRAELAGRLENLKKQYRAKHPDIIQTQTDIDKLNDELEKLAKNTDQRVKQASQSSQRKAELQKKSMEIEREKAEGQIAQIDRQLQMRDEAVRRNMGQIAALESKINTIPNVKVALEGINNQYEAAKSNYAELLKKYNNAQTQVQRENNAQGETIRVVDPANLPQIPENSKKRPYFLLVGTGAGLALGLLLAGAFELPRFFRIQNIDDAKHYTGLPVLASVPPLLTAPEIAAKNRGHWMNVIAGVAAAIISVPILVIALQASRIFER
jgi:uncharacterized protein involved in exopolysaccharide biosynthesis